MLFLVNPDMDNVSLLANPDMYSRLVCWKATSICLQGICWLVEFKFNLDKWAGIVGIVTWGYGLL